MGIDLGKIMVTPRGDYQDYVEYDRLDLVAYQGSSYIALKPVEGITPSEDGEYWQLHGSGAYQCAKDAGYEGTEEEFRAAQAGVPELKRDFTEHTHTASDVGAVPITRKVNNKPLSGDVTLNASDVGTINIYTEFPQIGLAKGSETIESIAKGLPDRSMLFTEVGGGTNLPIYPKLSTGSDIYGILEVEKINISRTAFTFRSNKYGRMWIGEFYTTSSGNENLWTGWKEVFTTDNITAGTSTLTAGTSKLNNDCIYQQYE